MKVDKWPHYRHFLIAAINRNEPSETATELIVYLNSIRVYQRVL